MPFLPCSPAPSSAYMVILSRWILVAMWVLLVRCAWFDCTSSISCLPSGHVYVCLFLPPLTITTSLFVELMVTLSLLVSLCTICNACCRSSVWYEIRAISSATVRHPMTVHCSLNFGSYVDFPKDAYELVVVDLAQCWRELSLLYYTLLCEEARSELSFPFDFCRCLSL